VVGGLGLGRKLGRALITLRERGEERVIGDDDYSTVDYCANFVFLLKTKS
jgi:hypothetical protein